MGNRKYTPLTNFDDIPGELPQGHVPQDADLSFIAQNAVVKLNNLQPSHLVANVIWRDLLCLTGFYRTFYSAPKVYNTLSKLSQQKKRSIFRLKEGRQPRLAHGGKECSWVDVDILFTAQHENLAENCMGTVSVIPDADGTWKIWMLRTWLECFDGRGHPDVLDPASGNENTNRVVNGTANGVHQKDSEEYDAIVVGGGQAGLSTAGRLKALGVNYLLLEKNEHIGDVWANRYDSLRWHTSKEYGNLPFGHTYPAEDDYMLPTKRIGAGHKAWSEKYDINLRTSTTVESATWDDTERRWTVTAANPEGKTTLKAHNVVLTIGPGHATPIHPSWATADKVQESGFKGTIVHAFSGYKSAEPWAGKRGIVIGVANTGHDIAEDMANAGMQTTMVQRNPTFIFPAEWLHRSEDVLYHADMHPAEADREAFTYPNKILREVINRNVWAGIKANPERFDALENAGFKVDRFGDIYNNLYVRLGGHYVDIGCSARIAKGEIKIKTQAVERLTEDGVLFEDGSEVGADLIVLCTGFDKVYRNDAARIIGKKVADQMDEFWGTDSEGEIRGHAKPAGRKSEKVVLLMESADFGQTRTCIIMVEMCAWHDSSPGSLRCRYRHRSLACHWSLIESSLGKQAFSTCVLQCDLHIPCINNKLEYSR